MLLDGFFGWVTDMIVVYFGYLDLLGGAWLAHVYMLVNGLVDGAGIAAVVGFAVPLNYLYVLVLAYFSILVLAIPTRLVVVVIEWVRGKGAS